MYELEMSLLLAGEEVSAIQGLSTVDRAGRDCDSQILAELATQLKCNKTFRRSSTEGQSMVALDMDPKLADSRTPAPRISTVPDRRTRATHSNPHDSTGHAFSQDPARKCACTCTIRPSSSARGRAAASSSCASGHASTVAFHLPSCPFALHLASRQTNGSRFELLARLLT
jgi:hypothetical protein